MQVMCISTGSLAPNAIKSHENREPPLPLPRFDRHKAKKKNDTSQHEPEAVAAAVEHKDTSQAIHSSHQQCNTGNEKPPLHYLTFARIMMLVLLLLALPSSRDASSSVSGPCTPRDTAFLFSEFCARTPEIPMTICHAGKGCQAGCQGVTRMNGSERNF